MDMTRNIMQLENKCVTCGVKMKFTEKDIRRLTKKEIEAIRKSNKKWEDALEEKEVIGFWKKKTVYKIRDRYMRTLYRIYSRVPYGILKCPVCKNGQYLSEDITY